MVEPPVPLCRPAIGEAEIAAVVEVLRSGWIAAGPVCAAFEAALAAYVEAPRAVAVSSCTAAVELGLRALDVTGLDVFTPTIGFCSTAHAIGRARGRLRLVDVDPATGQLDPDALERAIGRSRLPGAVVPVHLNGGPADMGAIDEIAARRGLPILEDAAHALPAVVDGRRIGDPTGPVPRLTAFSFQATSTITCADGGALTGPDDLLDTVTAWRLHGLSADAWTRTAAGGPTWRYDVTVPGLKANLIDVHAAIGLAQLGRAGELHAARVRIAAAYDLAFAGHPALQLYPDTPGRSSSHYVYPLALTTRARRSRDELLDKLARHGVGADVYFIPLHHFTVYARHGAISAFPGAAAYYRRRFALPCFAGLTDAEIARVVATVCALV